VLQIPFRPANGVLLSWACDMKKFGACAALLLNSALSPALGAERAEIPITQIQGFNGRAYYFIQVSVGGSTPFRALLDTGSTGLRLLPGAIGDGDAVLTDRTSSYGYGTGSQFTGKIARGVVEIGGLRTTVPVTMMLIDSVGCRSNQPSCPASGHTAEDFDFAEESGIPNPKRARIGISLAKSDADNPLEKFGNGAWIVDLPLPGETAPGRLIINPTPGDEAAFTRLRADPEKGTVKSCVSNHTDSVCGHFFPDTGGNGLVVRARQRPASFPWPNGASAVLTLQDDRSTDLNIDFTLKHVPGDPANLHWSPGNAPEPVLSGSYPFFKYSILFDAVHHELGFKPRSSDKKPE